MDLWYDLYLGVYLCRFLVYGIFSRRIEVMSQFVNHDTSVSGKTPHLDRPPRSGIREVGARARTFPRVCV